MTTLAAKKRELKKNLDALRKEGLIPAVVYGPKHDSLAIAVDAGEFQKAFREAGESTTITLDIDGEKIETLVQDIAEHPVRGQVVHADFLAIDTTKAVEVEVPLEFEGISGAVKTGLGTLVKVLHGIEISALPKNLPHSLSVDISKLETLDDQILVSDIALPSGVTAITPATEIVAIVSAAKEETEEEAPADLSAIEVEKKGKKEEEGAVSEEAAA